MTASRGVKKDPGRRPQRAKRLGSWELRWGAVVAPAREVGVSRTTGNNWSRSTRPTGAGEFVKTDEVAPDVVPAGYGDLLTAIQREVRGAQLRAARAANTELIELYWRIGGLIPNGRRASRGERGDPAAGRPTCDHSSRK